MTFGAKFIIYAMISMCILSGRAFAIDIHPWNVAKMNFGIDYLSPKISSDKKGDSNELANAGKLKNINLYVGGRFLRYFGTEAGYSKIGTVSELGAEQMKSDLKNYYLDAKFYLPIVYIPAFSFDLYFSYGISHISGKALYMQQSANYKSMTSPRYGFGAEFTVFGSLSARVGHYTLSQKLESQEASYASVLSGKKLTATYAGLSFYFL